METIQLNIKGMVCDACKRHVEKSLSGVAGVASVQVDRSAGEATVEHTGAVSEHLLAAVADAGYEAEVARSVP